MPDPAAGASLYGESFCASCHAVQNAAGNVVGGDVGPELIRIGSKVKPDWLRTWLRNPRVYDAGTAMPHYRFTDQQVSLLSGFLGNKTDADLLANVHIDAPTPEQIAHGKLLVTEYGCASCHEISGVKKPDNFAPELTRIGSKALTQIIFLPGMQHTLPDYISAKIRQPRSFGSALKMPQYTFAPVQIDALTTALLSFTDRAHDLPLSLTVPTQAPSHYQPAGKAGQLMADLACFSCHAINGRGSDMAPDLTWEGSSVQRPWLQAFLKNPGTLRPALIRRMPRFNLSDSDVSELTDYIMTVYQTPAFDRDSMPSSGYPPAQVEQGKQLFYSKYACQSCHIIDTKVDKGYIGPTLTQVRFAAERCLDLPLVERSAGHAARRYRAQPQHERRRCPCADRIPDGAQKLRQTGGNQMKRCLRILFVASLILAAGCSRKPGLLTALKPTAFGAALVESSGGKQIGTTGMVLPQPLVVQVNDEQGAAVPGALVEFSGPAGVNFDPPRGLTDSSGQATTNVQCALGRHGRPISTDRSYIYESSETRRSEA